MERQYGHIITFKNLKNGGGISGAIHFITQNPSRFGAIREWLKERKQGWALGVAEIKIEKYVINDREVAKNMERLEPEHEPL